MDLIEDQITPARAEIDEGIAELEAAIAKFRTQLGIFEAKHEDAVRVRHSLERLHREIVRVNDRLGRNLASWGDVERSATDAEQARIRPAHDRFHELAASWR